MAKQVKKTTKKTVKSSSKTVIKIVKSTNTIKVKNAEGDADTTATILIQNKIDYTPKVSVIIPVYNVEEYLRECLDNVVNQTLHEIEIICVDDGSTDKSLEILKEYAKKDNRITVITQENHGAGIARNCGLGVANGEFIAFMDPDDYYPAKNTLEHLYDGAIENKVDICGGSLNRLKDNVIITNPKEFEPEYAFDNNGSIDYQDYQFDYGYWRFIYSRKLLKDNNILFPDYLRQQDPVFFVKAMVVAGKFYALKEPTYMYRVSHATKPIEWTQRKCMDVAKSFRDLLVLSASANLDKLHNTIVKRVCSDWDINIFKNLVDENGIIHKSVIEMLKAFDYTIIYKKQPDFDLPVFYKKILPMCKISVIIPVYNVEKFLPQCLDSVINQTLKDIEMICINDGSSDNSLKILQQYAKKDDRIKIINQQNLGLATSRNNAIKIMRGKYCNFLDSDDYLVPDALEKLYNYATRHDLDMLAFSGNNFNDGDNVMLPNEYWDFTYLPQDWNKTVFTYKDCFDFMHKMAVSSCLTVYKAEFIFKNNLKFPDGLVYEDNIFWTTAFTKNAKFGILNEKLYRRRIHGLSITQNWQKNFCDWVRINDLLLTYLKSININKKVFNSYAVSRVYSVKSHFEQLPIQYKTAMKSIFDSFMKKYQKETKGKKINHIKSYLLFPYYGFANLWMKIISIPFAKFVRHTKQVLYSHSKRGIKNKG